MSVTISADAIPYAVVGGFFVSDGDPSDWDNGVFPINADNVPRNGGGMINLDLVVDHPPLQTLALVVKSPEWGCNQPE